MKIIVCITILLLYPVKIIFPQSFDKEYNSGNNFASASFRLWKSDTDEPLRALLVIVPGYNSDARELMSNNIWQDFAKKNGLAILGCFFKDQEQPVSFYREASKGSGQVLLDAIEELADKAGCQDIKELPLVLMGFSAGGQFNYEFACWKPEKVLSFVVNKGGFYHTGIAPEETRKIPGLFLYGETDLYYRRNMILGIYSANRKLGANWTLIMEKNTGHEMENSKGIAIQYFESIFPLRLNDSGELQELDTATHIIGDWVSKKSTLTKEKVNSDEFTIWLPDQNFARTWEKLHDYSPNLEY